MKKISAFIRIALAYCIAATTFAGCNGSQTSTIPGGTSFSKLKAPATSHDQKSGDAATSNQNFLYVGSTCYYSCGSSVSVYTFPEGQLIGSWTGANALPAGECADDAGNVFVTYTDFTSGYVGEILKFAHGSTVPEATLRDGTAFPVACSVDPISGSLAVINGLDYSMGTLSIYRNDSETPTTYSYPGLAFYGVSYDNKGNIFVNGNTPPPSSKLVFLELRKGRRSFENIALNVQFGSAGELEWNGTHLMLGLGNSTYRLDIQGRFGSLVGVTQLKRIRGGIDQYWFVGKEIVAAYTWKPCPAICGREGAVGIWHYPSGHVITKSITPYLSPPTGMALSLAQHHR
jgi:hypothetical protein